MLKIRKRKGKKQISCRLIMWQMFRLEIELREDKWRDNFLFFFFSLSLQIPIMTYNEHTQQLKCVGKTLTFIGCWMFAVGPNQRIKSKFAIVHSNRINLERISYMSHLLPAGTIFISIHIHFAHEMPTR